MEQSDSGAGAPSEQRPQRLSERGLRHEFGKLLKRRRLELHYSQEDVARHLRITQPAYSQYESGTTVPTFSHLDRLNRLLHCHLQEEARRSGDAARLGVHPEDLCEKYLNLSARLAEHPGSAHDWQEQFQQVDPEELVTVSYYLMGKDLKGYKRMVQLYLGAPDLRMGIAHFCALYGRHAPSLVETCCDWIIREARKVGGAEDRLIEAQSQVTKVALYAKAYRPNDALGALEECRLVESCLRSRPEWRYQLELAKAFAWYENRNPRAARTAFTEADRILGEKSTRDVDAGLFSYIQGLLCFEEWALDRTRLDRSCDNAITRFRETQDLARKEKWMPRVDYSASATANVLIALGGPEQLNEASKLLGGCYLSKTFRVEPDFAGCLDVSSAVLSWRRGEVNKALRHSFDAAMHFAQGTERPREHKARDLNKKINEVENPARLSGRHFAEWLL